MTPDESGHEHRRLAYAPAWLVLLMLATIALAWPGMTSPVLLDDKIGLDTAAGYTSWSDIFKPDSFGLLRPFKNAFFYAFVQMGEISLPLWHGLVIACFALATASVYLLLRRLTGSDLMGLIGAAMCRRKGR